MSRQETLFVEGDSVVDIGPFRNLALSSTLRKIGKEGNPEPTKRMCERARQWVTSLVWGFGFA